MEVTKLGEGEAEYVVVGSVHGDEPCGKQAIKRFIESGYDLQEPVKFIIANEEALEQDKRFLDVDLNRNFPGDSESNEHEERLAAKIMKEIKGKRFLIFIQLVRTRILSQPSQRLIRPHINCFNLLVWRMQFCSRKNQVHCTNRLMG